VITDDGFGRKVVAPLLWSFQAKYPDIDNWPQIPARHVSQSGLPRQGNLDRSNCNTNCRVKETKHGTNRLSARSRA
jgi:hypothetical protein